jgi:glutamate synthase domain-containing protein 3
VIELAEDSIVSGEAATIEMRVRTDNRTVGAKVANAITVRHPGGLPENTITIRLTGSAGQSFGAFIVDGMRLDLEGEANDYVGKGMSGGTIAIRPPERAPFNTPQTIAGNTNLYGATGGQLFAAGKVGERFGVRNSGAVAVVEGVGDHGCEYMTGGAVVVLGPTGHNFGAGMTNGSAFVYDPHGAFSHCINGESVLLERMSDGPQADTLRSLLEQHVAATGSAQARSILNQWPFEMENFWNVIPRAALAMQMANETQAEAASAGETRGVAD